MMYQLLKICSVFLLCLNFAVTTLAQTVVLSGQVKSKANSMPIADVMVTLRWADKSNAIKFTKTDSNGYFQMTVTSFPTNQVLHFAMMGYAPQDIAVSEGQNIYHIVLTEKVTQLKEVTVKAKGIRMKDDTISYLVSKYAKAQDKTLADVLKKMPGIEVDKSGAIKYNGVEINKFYIEGKDMLEGRYGLATNNIHQKDVGTVEVMENHQPIKALENISFSQNPAINIKLKDAAKSRWAGNAKLGLGFSPLLWNSQLFAMRFTRKAQSLDTYKSNNIGEDLSRETRVLSLADMISSFGNSYRLSNYISLGPSLISQTDDRRTKFNKTHLVSTNNLWSLGKDFDLTSQISYLNDRTESDSHSEIQYYLNDKTITTIADEYDNEKQNQLTAEITLKANTSKYYVENKLNTDLRWDNLHDNIFGTYPNLQFGKLPYRKVEDDIELIKRSGKKIYTVYSYNIYQQKPHQLLVERDGTVQHQNICSSAFYTHTNTSIGFVLNPFTVSMKTGLVGTFRSMKSDLTGVPDSIGGMVNNLSMNYLNIYVSPEVEINTTAFNLTLKLPVSYVPYWYYDKLLGNTNNTNKLFVSPSLSINYYITSKFSASASGDICQTGVNEQLFYSGLLLGDYHNLYQGYIDYRNGHSTSASLNLAYRDPLKAFFSRLEVGYQCNYSPLSSSRRFVGDYILNSYLNHDNRSRNWSINGRISKGVDWLGTILTLNSNYSKTTASIYQNDVETNYSCTIWNINPKLTMSPAYWCNFSYELNYNRTWLMMKNTSVETNLSNLSQTTTVAITPSKIWYLKLKCEHYYNEITNDVKKTLVLADADFTYCFKGGWELNLAVTNIFDQHNYAYRSYSGTTSLYQSYKIRPRNVVASVYFRF